MVFTKLGKQTRIRRSRQIIVRNLLGTHMALVPVYINMYKTKKTTQSKQEITCTQKPTKTTILTCTAAVC